MAQTGSEAALCVLSFDGASDLWAPFFDAFAAAWPDCPLPIYLLTNHKIYDGPHPVTTLAIGDDVDWSANLIVGLKLIPEDRILFTFDDLLPRTIDADAVLGYIQKAQRNDWPYLTLHPNNYRREVVESGVRRIDEAGVYRCTLVYGLFDKDYLRTLLVPGENAWEFEIESGQRAAETPLFSVDRRVFRHYHLLRKGVWMRPGYDRIVGRYPLTVTRPVESYAACIKREIKEWLFRKYHRWVPARLVEKRETRRRTG